MSYRGRPVRVERGQRLDIIGGVFSPDDAHYPSAADTGGGGGDAPQEYYSQQYYEYEDILEYAEYRCEYILYRFH